MFKINRILLLIMMLFSAACGSNHCIKFNGEYQGVVGGVEWCYNPVKSEINKRPTFIDTNGKEVVAFGSEDVASIWAKLVKTGKSIKDFIGIRLTADQPYAGSKVSQILEIIQKE